MEKAEVVLAPIRRTRDDDGGVYVSEYAEDPSVAAMIPRFLSEVPGRLGAIKDFMRECDWAGMAKQTHQLRGSAAVYGFVYLSELSAVLEEVLISEPVSSDRATSLFDRLEDFCGKLIARNTGNPCS